MGYQAFGAVNCTQSYADSFGTTVTFSNKSISSSDGNSVTF